jgi:hypothetical protein
VRRGRGVAAAGTLVAALSASAHTSGTSDGFVQSSKALIALGADVVVTGHGTLVTNAALETRMKETSDKQAKVNQARAGAAQR